MKLKRLDKDIISMSDELTDEEIKAANYNTGVSDPALHLPVPPRRWWKAFQPMIATRIATARNDALEEAAKWHDEQAEVVEELGIKKIASFHRDAAFDIRSLKSETKP